jgi:PAS domain S-box-containing protein
MTIARQFAVLIVVPFLLVMALGVALTSQFVNLSAEGANLIANLQRTATLNQELAKGNGEQTDSLQQQLVRPDPSFIDRSRILNYSLGEKYTEYLKLDIGDQERLTVETVKSLQSEASILSMQIYEQIQAGDRGGADARLRHLDQLQDQILGAFETLNGLQLEKLRGVVGRLNSAATRGLVAVIVFVAALVGVFGAMTVVLRRRILRPVGAILAASERMRNGDLSARAPAGQTDEFGQLTQGFNFMAATLAESYGALERKVDERTNQLVLAMRNQQKADAQLHVQGAALAAAANAIVITDRAGLIEWVNQAFSDLTGYTAAEAAGKNPRDLVKSGQHDPVFYQTLWHTILSGQVWRGEMINRRKDGRLYTEEQAITPVRDAQGGISHFIAIKQDITQRKHADEEIRSRARQAAFGADVAIALTEATDLQKGLLHAAEAMVRHLDAAVARIWLLDETDTSLNLTASAGLVTHPGEITARVAVGQFKVGRIAAEGRSHVTNDIAHDQEFLDASWAVEKGLVSFAGHPLVVNDQVVGVMTMMARHTLSDSTVEALASVARTLALGIERKRAERRITMLASAIESTNEMVSLTDLDDRFIFVNRAFLDVYGYREEDVIGRTPEILWTRTMTPEIMDEILRTSRHKGWHGELVNRRKDGTELTISLSTSPVRDAQGRILGLLGVGRDITEQKELESQVRAAQKVEAVGQLAAGLAHDFNNLLTVILGYSRMIEEEMDSADPRRPDIIEVIKAGERAAHLTRQLLAFSRKQILQLIVLNLNDVIDDMSHMLRRVVGEEVEVTLALDADLGAVKVDRSQMEQILVNLCVNARDAMDRGGRLTIETANVDLTESSPHQDAVQTGRHVRLAVTDTGTGMDDATMQRIYEPFFTTKERGKGTGLGLATVFSIVKQSHGSIGVDSVIGRGTTFTLWLPRVDEAPEDRRVASMATVNPGGSETILLVDDEDAVRGLVQAVLERSGYTVKATNDPREAIRIAREDTGPIDLLVTDVVMPGLSGPDLFAQLRETRRRLLVLYVSGFPDDAIAHHGVIDVSISFLQKPFTAAALVKKVRDTLDNRGAA